MKIIVFLISAFLRSFLAEDFVERREYYLKAAESYKVINGDIDGGTPNIECKDFCKEGCTFYTYCDRYDLSGRKCCSIGYGPVNIEQGFSSTYSIAHIIGNKAVKIKHIQTGMVLDGNDNKDIYTHVVNDGNYQVWSVFANVDGTVYLKNAQTGFYLESDGTFIKANVPNKSDYQRWFVNKQLQLKNNTLCNKYSGRCLAADDRGMVYMIARNALTSASEFVFEG